MMLAYKLHHKHRAMRQKSGEWPPSGLSEVRIPHPLFCQRHQMFTAQYTPSGLTMGTQQGAMERAYFQGPEYKVITQPAPTWIDHILSITLRSELRWHEKG